MYIIRHIGSRDFISGFKKRRGSQNPEPIWVEGWDNPEIRVYESEADALADQELVRADGLISYIENVTRTDLEKSK